MSITVHRISEYNIIYKYNGKVTIGNVWMPQAMDRNNTYSLIWSLLNLGRYLMCSYYYIKMHTFVKKWIVWSLFDPYNFIFHGHVIEILIISWKKISLFNYEHSITRIIGKSYPIFLLLHTFHHCLQYKYFQNNSIL